MAKRTETDLLRFYGGDIKVRTEKNGFQMLYNKERPRKVRGVGKCLHKQNSSRTIYDRLCEIRNLLS